MFKLVLLSLWVQLAFCLKCAVNINGEQQVAQAGALCAVAINSGCTNRDIYFAIVPKSEITKLINPRGCIKQTDGNLVTCFCELDNCNRNFTFIKDEIDAVDKMPAKLKVCATKLQRKKGDRGAGAGECMVSDVQKNFEKHDEFELLLPCFRYFSGPYGEFSPLLSKPFSMVYFKLRCFKVCSNDTTNPLSFSSQFFE